MRYSIDTSAILDGWRRYYPPSVFPGLWARLETLIRNGDLQASEEVIRELEKRDDEVLAWAERQDGFVAALTDEVQVLLRGVTVILREGAPAAPWSCPV